MAKHWYVAPEHFRRQAGSKTKQVKLKIRGLVSADSLLDKKYVQELSDVSSQKKKGNAEN